MNLQRISTTQLIAMVVVSRLSLTMVYWAPHPVSRYDEWWHGPLYVGLGATFTWLLSLVWRRYPELTFAQVLEKDLGRVFGKLVLLLYVLFFLLVFSLTLRLTGEVFLFAFLPRTPIIVVLGVMAALSVWGAKAGLEVMGRAATVIMAFLLVTVGLLFVLLAPEIDFHRLWPPRVLLHGPLPNLQDSFAVTSRTVEFAWVLMMVPFIEPHARLSRSLVYAFVWLAASWTLVTIMLHGVMGEAFGDLQFPVYTVSQMMELDGFVERLEGVLVAGWVFGFFVRAGLMLWAGAVGMAQGLGLTDYRPLLMPMAALGVTYSVAQAESLPELVRFLRPEIFFVFTLTFVLMIPLAVLGVRTVRNLFDV